MSRFLNTIHITILISLSLLCSSYSGEVEKGAAPHGEWSQAQYRAYLTFPSQSLLDKGDDFLYSKRLTDSAFICFTIVAERYKPNMDRDEMALCLEGFYGRWQTRFFGYGNFTSALEDLNMAHEIVEHTGLPSHKLDYYTGVCYLSLGANSYEDWLFVKGAESFKKSVKGALENKDYRTLHRAFDNLVSATLHVDSLGIMREEVEIMKNLSEPEMWRKRVSMLMYEVVEAQFNGNLKLAAEKNDSLIAAMPRNSENSRYLAAAFIKRSNLHLQQNNPQATIADLDSVMALTIAYDMPDIRQTAFRIRSKAYDKMGDSVQAHYNNIRYLEIKDSLYSERFMANFQEVNFEADRRRMQRDLDESDYQSRLRGWFIVFAVVLLVVLIGFLLMLNRKNRLLRQRSSVLYSQLQTLINKPEEWLRSNGTKNSGSGKACGGGIESSDSINSKDIHVDSYPPSDRYKKSDRSALFPSDKSAEKYSGSAMSDIAKSEMADKISDVLLKSQEIYSSDFSLGQLSAMLDSNSKYVSQCINERFGCNYSTLINRARVREAMRRLDDPAFNYYSIEGIAESVGFRSRSSFSLWFKKFTGLGASEYRQLAAEKQAKQ